MSFNTRSEIIKNTKKKEKEDKKRVRERCRREERHSCRWAEKKKDPTAAKEGRKKWDEEETELDKGGVIHQLLWRAFLFFVY